MNNNINEFIDSIKKVKKNRIHKVNNSFGVYDSYKWIRKNKWLNIGKPITEHQFYTIIRSINDYYSEQLSTGNSFKIPYKMGIIELRKYKSYIKEEDGKIKTNLPIDWDRTIRLWYEDQESYKDKTLIKKQEKEIFKFCYNKSSAEYINKSFFNFKINRSIKIKLKENINNGIIDAFIIS